MSVRASRSKGVAAVPWLLGALLLVAGVGAGVGCDADAPAVDAPLASAAPEASEAAPTEIRVARVRRGSILQRVSAPASLVALRESRIGAEVRGRIERVFVQEGDRVEAGAPLFQIDREPYDVALRQARAGVDVARAERRQLAADVTRARELRSQDIISEQEVDRLATKLSVAKARERQAEQELALAQQNLDRTLVASPYTGSVAKRLVDEGTTALVQPQTIVIVFQQTDELEGQATIPESHLALVQVGDPVLVHVEGRP